MLFFFVMSVSMSSYICKVIINPAAIYAVLITAYEWFYKISGLDLNQENLKAAISNLLG